jgi:lycopene cyclase domain-containing protein
VTYGAFLLVFLVIPIALLSAILRAHLRRHHLVAGGLICLLAFAYTTPWDNYAARKGLWSFDRAFVLGHPFWFGYLPLEEYLFYFAEAIFVCLVVVALSRVPMLGPSPLRGGGPGTRAARGGEEPHGLR